MAIYVIEWPKVASTLQASLTPVIGAAAIALTYATYKIQKRQAETQKQLAETAALQLRLALFEKRMKVFDSTMDLIAAIVREAKVELPRLFDFLGKTRENEFLFGSEINEFNNRVNKQGVELHYQPLVAVGERDFNKEKELMAWFVDQMTEGKRVFLPYIDFRQP